MLKTFIKYVIIGIKFLFGFNNEKCDNKTNISRKTDNSIDKKDIDLLKSLGMKFNNPTHYKNARIILDSIKSRFLENFEIKIIEDSPNFNKFGVYYNGTYEKINPLTARLLNKTNFEFCVIPQWDVLIKFNNNGKNISKNIITVNKFFYATSYI